MNMWTRFAFLLIALAAASAEYGWKSGQEYTYKVTSKTLTGLQTAPQYSGLVVKADLIIRVNTDQELIAVIDHAKRAEIHTQLQKGHEFEIPSEILQFQSFALTKQPFIIRLKEGIVDEVVISKEVPIWEVNVIKSIVSQLQVDTQGKRVIRSKMNMIPQQENELTAVYKTMEDTVEGECEVLYDISPLPKYILQRKPYLAPLYEHIKEENMINVVKTKNFTNCEHRPGYHYGITGMTRWEPAANKMGNFLSRSSVGRIVLSGNLKTYTIHSTETTNLVTVTSELGSGEKSTVLSRVNLTLVAVNSIQGQIEQPTHPQAIKTLVYNYNHPTKKDQEARQQWDQQNELHRGKTRLGRSIRNEGNNMNKMYSSDRTSSESSSMSVESWHQETPKLSSVPQNPFLPYFVGCKGHSIRQCENINVQQVVKTLCEQIGTQLQEPSHVPQASTLERFSILVRVIRNMDVEQLRKVTEELSVKDEGSKTVQNPRRSYWMAFRDAVAQAGTGPALVTIKEWILTDKIHGEEAAQVIASLMHSTMHPTTEYMKTFFELVKNEKVMNQKYLNTTAIYSFTKLVRFAQVDRQTIHNRYPVHVFGRLTPHDDKIVAEEFIPYFGAKLQQAVQEQDTPKTLVYIRALGNVAHPKILAIFEPYLEGQFPVSDFQRTLIVISLNDLAKTHPRIARSVLYKTFSNLGEVSSVRVAAVYNLMKTVPPVNMLQRMAEASHDDPSIQVRSAIKSAIESAALLKNAVNIELRRNAQAAVNMLTPEVFGIHYSRKNLTDFILKDLNFGYTDTFSYIGSEDSNLPSSIFYGLRTQIHTYQRKYFKVGTMVSSQQDLKDFLMKIFSVGENESQEHPVKDEEWSYEKIIKTLNVEHELMKQVEGTILFRLAGGERYLTFDNHTIEDLMEKLYQLPYTLAMGSTHVYQKLYNSHNYQVAFPTVTGFPFVFTLETPRLLCGRGQIQVNAPKMNGNRNRLSEMTHFAGTVNVRGVYSSRTQSKVGFVTPFDHKHYLAGIHQEHQINVPMKMDVNVNLENFQVKLDIQPYDKTGDLKVFQFKTDKYTTIEDITGFKPVTEGSNTKRIQIRKPQKFERIIGEKDGLGVRVEVETQKRHLDWQTLQMAWKRHNMISTLVFPTVGETVENTKIDVYCDKTFANSISVNIGVYGSLVTGYNRKKGVNTQDRPKMVQEVLGEIQRGIQSPETFAWNAEWSVPGQNKYSTTFGYGYSPVAEETKFVARYLRQGQQPYELCLNMATKMPFLPETDFTKAIGNHPQGQVQAELRFGESGCQNGAHVTLAGKFERTPERTQYLKTLPQTQACMNEMKNDNKLLSGCMNATYNANLLNRYIFTIKYDKVPVVAKNYTYKVYSFLRQLGYPYLDEKWNIHENTQEKKIDLDVQFSPDLKSVSTHLTSPLGSAYFKDVRVNKYFRSAFVLHPRMSIFRRFGWSALRQQYDAFCTIDKTMTKTFDNVTYPVHLTNQWIPVFVSVPKINQEGQLVGVHKVAVLAKEISGNHKEVVIYTSENSNQFSVAVHVKPLSSEGIGITVNGQEIKFQRGGKPYEHYDKNGKLIVRVYTVADHEVKIEFPECDFKILYGVSRFQIIAEDVYKNRVLGLCGDYNGERFDYVTPKGKYLRDPEEFVATWALTNEASYAQLKERAEKNAVPKTVILTGIVSDQDAGRTDKRGRPYTNEQQLRGYYDSSSSSSSESSEHTGKCISKRIMVIERDGKHCFSVNAQPSCNTGCQVEKTKTMTTRFVCVNKTQTSSHWANMVTRGAQPNLGEKLSNAQELTFEAPVECSQI